MKRRHQLLTPVVILIAGTVILAACDSDSVADGNENGDGEPGAPTAIITSSHDAIPRNDGNQTIITMDGSGSSDPDGDDLTYRWVVPSGTFVNGTTSTDAIIQITFPGLAPYTVQLTVTDSEGLTDSASFTVSVN